MIRWPGHNIGPSVFVWRLRHLVILPRGGLEGDRDERAGRTEQAVREFVEICGLAKGKPKTTKYRQTAWLSDDGIAAPDGLSVFNLTDVEIKGL